MDNDDLSSLLYTLTGLTSIYRCLLSRVALQLLGGKIDHVALRTALRRLMSAFTLCESVLLSMRNIPNIVHYTVLEHVRLYTATTAELMSHLNGE